MIKSNLLILFLVLLAGNAFAYDLHLNDCRNTGSFSFNMKTIGSEKIDVNNLKLSVISPSGKTFDINNQGKWDTKDIISSKGDGSLFNSNEGIFSESGRYMLNLNYGSNARSAVFNCPGLLFSCQLLDIRVNSCSNENGIFKTELTVKGLKPSDLASAKVIDLIDGLDYTFSAEKPYEDINGNIMAGGSLPKNYKMTELGDDKYLFEAEMGENIVNSLRVAYTRKDSYKYIFELDECYSRASKLNGNLYGFRMCEVLNSAEIIDEGTVKNVEVPVEEKNNFGYYFLVGILVLIILYLIFRKKKENKLKIKTLSVK